MSPKDRIKSLQDGPVLDGLIKAHIKEEPMKCTGLWKTDEIEDAVENFNAFLCSVAVRSCRLSKNALLQSLKKLFKTDPVTLEDFAGKLSQALRYCYEKGKRLTSGKKTSQAALKVITAYGLKTPKQCSSQSDLEVESDGVGKADPVDLDGSDTGDGELSISDLFSEPEGDEASAALQAAQKMYKSYSGAAAASSYDVVDLTDAPSPVKSSQVPHMQP
jgi:hypothetical protein